MALVVENGVDGSGEERDIQRAVGGLGADLEGTSETVFSGRDEGEVRDNNSIRLSEWTELRVG